eukprot:COSAG06_NODE_25117_length_644_cov_4.216514_1_plen_68_part_01
MSWDAPTIFRFKLQFKPENGWGVPRQHTDNAEFSAKMDSMDPPVQVIMLQTQCDKRANGAGEGLMYLI